MVITPRLEKPGSQAVSMMKKQPINKKKRKPLSLPQGR